MRETRFKQREILVALNNAVVHASRPKGKDFSDRNSRLLEYTRALIEPIMEHIDENLLSPEEAVYVLVAGALLIQCRLMNLTHVPALPGVRVES